MNEYTIRKMETGFIVYEGSSERTYSPYVASAGGFTTVDEALAFIREKLMPEPIEEKSKAVKVK